MVGYQRTHARALESVKHWAPPKPPSQARILHGRRGGLEQVQSYLPRQRPSHGRQRPYRGSEGIYTPHCPRTRQLVPSRHSPLLNLRRKCRCRRVMAGSMRRIQRRQWSLSRDVAIPTLGTRAAPLRPLRLAQLEHLRSPRGKWLHQLLHRLLLKPG
jgi:hypothetical protein